MAVRMGDFTNVPGRRRWAKIEQDVEVAKAALKL
jgi:hypothetical protein